MLLFRVWHPTQKEHDLGQIGTETVSNGICIGKPIEYSIPFGILARSTSNVKSLEKLTDGDKSVVYKVVTETGSIYQVVFLK